MGLPGDIHSKKIRPRQTNSSLSSEEGFLLSRLGGGLALKEILPLCPWPEDQILKLLDQLLQKAAIEFIEEVKSSVPSSALTQQLQAEESDPVLRELDREFRRQILLKFQTLENQNPYEVLDLAKNATTHAIKVQYLALSKSFHPDRFFRKKLGHYKEKLDKIFGKIQKSYEALSDPHQREVLDRMQVVATAQKTKTKEQMLKSIRQLDPKLEKNKKAEKFYQEGLELQRQQDFIGAHNAFTLASSTTPGRTTYTKAIQDVKPLVNKQKGISKLNHAKGLAQFNLPEEALQASNEALKHQPDNAEAQVIWAKAILDLKKSGDYKLARERLKTAKSKLSRDPEPCFLLGKVLMALKDPSGAKLAFEEALKRDPHHAESKILLEDL